jgi:single-strand DNA-binding protein
MSLANISIVGNLVRTPEQMMFANGKTKTTIVVAVNVPSRINKGAEGADFYRLEAWGKLAELAATYLAKGNQITATGRLVLEKWTDKEGRERMTPTIKADQIVFPSKPKDAIATVRAAPISGELEYADSGETANQTMHGETTNQTVANFNVAANTLNGQSALITSSSPADSSPADFARAAPPPLQLSAAGQMAQSA